MNAIVKPAIVKSAMVLGIAGVLAIGSMSPSEARNRGWVAAGIGLAAAAVVGAAVANANNGYYGSGYGYGPGYGYAPDYGYAPAYVAPGYGYAPGYVEAPAYAYAPGYVRAPAYGYTDPGNGYYAPIQDYSYNTNTTSAARERQLRGIDY